jgi:arsenite transporter
MPQHHQANDSIAVGLLVMMYPILCKVKYETLHLVFAHREIWVQLAFSVVVNWIIAPLLMVSQSVSPSTSQN